MAEGSVALADSKQDEIFRLADGRAVGFRVPAGDAALGVPVFYCHGFPGSRLEPDFAETPCLRLISVDRPGYGRSSPHPARRLMDWPNDVAALADHLGFKQFRMLGVSGGTPYALACAAAMPERIDRVALVCPLGPPEAPGMDQGLPGRLLDIGRRHGLSSMAAKALRLLVSRQQLAEHAMAMRRQLRRRKGLASLEEKAFSPEFVKHLAMNWHEALAQSEDGIRSDAQIYATPWPFSLNDIQVSVSIWHGAKDETVPVSVGRYLHEKLGNSHASFPVDDGHFSVVLNHMAEFINYLKR